MNDTNLCSEVYENVIMDLLNLLGNQPAEEENIEIVKDESEERLWEDYELKPRIRQTDITPRDLALHELDNYLKEPCKERRRDPIIWWNEN